MAEELWSKGRPFTLHYLARTSSRMAFRARLLKAPYRDKVNLYLDDAPATLRPDLSSIIGMPEGDRQIYICGPGSMMNAALKVASDQGWPDAQVHVERFASSISIGDLHSEGAFKVQVGRNGLIVDVQPGESIVQALEAAGVIVETPCEQGICGTCLVRVLEGRSDHRDT